LGAADAAPACRVVRLITVDPSRGYPPSIRRLLTVELQFGAQSIAVRDRSALPRAGSSRAVAQSLPDDGTGMNSVGNSARPGPLVHVSTLDDALAAFNPTELIKGKTIIRVRP
jgi:hypothetical protein